MPRCVICDSCSETGTGDEVTRAYHFDEKEKGYVCSHCIDEIGQDLSEFQAELEFDELLEVQSLGTYEADNRFD